jgi:hypothetical protein
VQQVPRLVDMDARLKPLRNPHDTEARRRDAMSACRRPDEILFGVATLFHVGSPNGISPFGRMCYRTS